MASKVTILSAGFLLVVLTLSGLAPYSSLYTRAQSGTGVPSQLEIGFGIASLSPVQDGIPIFTANDSLWVLSSYAQPITIDLTSPIAGQVVSISLLPSVAQSIYTFSSNDSPGNWSLSVTLQNSTVYTLPIPVVLPAQASPTLSLTEYSIQNGLINLGFSTNPLGAYNLEACLTSNTANNTLFVSEPSSLGSGQVSLLLGNSTAFVSIPAKPTQPFSFYFELYYPYAFEQNLPNVTVSKDLQVLRSNTVLFSSNASEATTLNMEASLRPGRYVIYAYFDSSSGLTLETANALLESNGDWFWLDGCNPFSITQLSFSKQVSLNQNPSSWPTTVYFMYNYEGVEGYTASQLQINLARIDFYGEPGNVKLSYLNFAISNNSNIEASGVFSGSLFIIPKSFPAFVSITPMAGSEKLSSQTVEIAAPFTDSQVLIPVGLLVVQVTNNSKPDNGASVGITSGQGLGLSSGVGTGGNTSFYLPNGAYNITVSKGRVSEVRNATVNDGTETFIQFTFASVPIVTGYDLELLLIPLAIGLLLNVWVWILRPRRRPFTLR